MDLISAWLLMVSDVDSENYWIATLGGGSDDRVSDIAVDGNGNVYVTGYAVSDGLGGWGDCLTAKYDTNGVIQWQRRLGGASDEGGSGIIVDGSGNVYVCGTAHAKYNASGILQWQRLATGNKIVADGAGNYYSIGSVYDAGSWNFLIVKYNTDGIVQWGRKLGGVANDLAADITFDASGNVYVTGKTSSDSVGSSDVLIAKYNTNGVIQWQRRLGGASDDEGSGITVDGSGNVYVCGSYQYPPGSMQGVDIVIAKYNTNGVIQWQRTLGGEGTLSPRGNVIDAEDYGKGVAVDGAGNVYVLGGTITAGAGGEDIVIAKYNTNGVIQWQRTLGGAGNDYSTGITVDGSGNVYVCASSNSAGEGSYDYLIAKLPSDGSLTGTYGSLTYAACSLIDSSSSLTGGSASLIDSSFSLTSISASLTDVASSLTSTTTLL